MDPQHRIYQRVRTKNVEQFHNGPRASIIENGEGAISWLLQS